MHYTAAEITSVTGAVLHGPGNLTVTSVLYDSRLLNRSQGVLFMARKGQVHDGHQYITELYESGVRVFLVASLPINIHEMPDAAFLLCSDPLSALQELAAFHRQQFDIPVIAITGSHGKTIVKEWLFHLLSDTFQVVRSPKSFNSQLGVPLSLLQISDADEIAIIEAAAIETGEMQRLTHMIAPTHGIFTNFSGSTEMIKEIVSLFQDAQKVVLPDKYIPVFEPLKKLELVHSGQLETALPDVIDSAAARENIELAYAMAKAVGCSNATLNTAIQSLPSIAMRLERSAGINGCVLINDSYSNDLSGLASALHFFREQAGNLNRVAILSDIRAGQSLSDSIYRDVARLLEESGIQECYGVGSEIVELKEYSDIHFMHFASTTELSNYLRKHAFRNSCILIKGRRSFGFEKLISQLQELTHRTTLEIDLSVIRSNFRETRKLIGTNTRIMCMVKAFSYGTASAEVARVLDQQGVDYFGVAYPNEGIVLREAGIDTPIMIISPEPAAFGDLTYYHLEPALSSLDMIESFLHQLIREGARNYPVHIEFDTGMHRLGIDPKDARKVALMLKAQPEVRIASVFSHLAASDDPEEDDFTLSQIKTLQCAVDTVKRITGQDFLCHIANSAAIRRFPSAHMDMVRLGIDLYGKENVAAVRLLSKVAQIKKIKAGESIGYNRSFRAARDMIIAIIPIGYADGVRRSLSNGVGFFSIAGKRAPVVGKVCMDLTMVDISGLPVKVGDEVEVFGNDITLQEFAQMMGTIPYEVLTSVNRRVKRIYIDE